MDLPVKQTAIRLRLLSPSTLINIGCVLDLSEQRCFVRQRFWGGRIQIWSDDLWWAHRTAGVGKGLFNLVLDDKHIRSVTAVHDSHAKDLFTKDRQKGEGEDVDLFSMSDEKQYARSFTGSISGMRSIGVFWAITKWWLLLWPTKRSPTWSTRKTTSRSNRRIFRKTGKPRASPSRSLFSRQCRIRHQAHHIVS